MIKRFLFIFLFTTFAINLFGSTVNVIKETQTGVEFQVTTPRAPDVKKDLLSPAITSFSMDDAKYEKHDSYLLPYWSFKIALPDTVTPTIQISNIRRNQFSSSNEIDVSAISDFLDLPLYEISDFGFSGEIPTMVLRVNPLSLISGNLTYISDLSIAITYNTPYSGKISKNSGHNTTFINQHSTPYSSISTRNLQKTTAPNYPSGKWLRVTISDESNSSGYSNQYNNQNIFKVPFSVLSDAGITETSISKNRIFLFSNSNSGKQIDDFTTLPLFENSRSFVNESSNFSDGDYLYFYGMTPSRLYINRTNKLNFNRNPYSFENYYWILIADESGSPKAIESIPNATGSSDYTITKTDFLFRKERESGGTNVLESGNDWYGKLMDGRGSSVSENFYLPASENNYDVDITIRLKSGSEKISQYYDIILNNSQIKTAKTSNYGYDNVPIDNVELTPANNYFSIKMVNGSGKGYLDYIQCKYKVELDSKLNNCLFFAPDEQGLIDYRIKNDYSSSFNIFDISDPTTIKKINISTNSSEVSFKAKNNEKIRNQYLMVKPSDYREIESVELINSPDFTSLYTDKSAQYIIITDESFLSAADQIAEIHNSKVHEDDRLTTFITTQSNIFRQFNGDVRDPEAIRSFLLYAYNNWAIKPQYVLLFGDGSYDHRKIKSETNNFVMTYQVSHRDAGYDYYASDFRYTYLSGDDKLPEVAIGRVPVSNANEANNYAKKLEQYLISPTYGPWRHKFSLVADDPEDPDTRQTEFTRDSELLANSLLPNIFTYNKLYLLEYPDVQDDSKYGRTKPAATEAILESLHKGTTIINYMGHGALNKWSQESAFTGEHLADIDNKNKLPFWIAGTCTWGKFDEIYEDCMPEKLITMKDNGGIAALGATRPTYLSPNFYFLKSLFNYWFPDNSIRKARIGDVIKYNLNGSDSNDEKYILFGDPALYISLPNKQANFTKLGQDTLKALQNVKISGSTENTTFSGDAIVSLYDSKQKVTRYYEAENHNQYSYSYKLPGDILFKGKTTVDNGQFQSSFYIPKDLNYSNDFGKIHIYGWNEETQEEFSGIYDSIYFAGSETVVDSIGPMVEFLKNDHQLHDSGVISASEQLLIKLTDKHGINLTGKMGHGISAVINDNAPIDLTENFSYSENNDTSGTLSIPLENLDFGSHDIRIKAWDNANNASERLFNFTYRESEKFKLSKVVNYPNPFKNTTDITFYTSELCKFSISIYTVNGLKVREFKSLQSSGDGFTKVYWNAKDDFGDKVARGIYFYKVKAKSLVTNKKDNYIGKMVKS